MTPVIIHSLGDRDYGLWALVGSFVFYFGLMDFGLSSATARFLSRAQVQHRPQDEKEYVDTGIIIYILLSLGVVVMGLIIMALGPVFVKQPEVVGLFRLLVAITALNVAVYLPFRVFFGILKARLQYDIMSAVSIILTVIKGILVYGFLTHGFGVISLALISLAMMLAETLAIYRYASRFGIFSWRKIHFKRSRMRELFSYSIYTFIASVAELLIQRIDSLVITFFLNLERITPYSLASSLIRYGNEFTISILGTLEPVFSQEEGRSDLRNMHRILLLTSKISAVICTQVYAGAAIYGHDFILCWIGKDYGDLHEVILWLCLGNFATSVQRPAISLLYGISKHHLYAWMNMVEGIANLLLSIMLVQRYNIAGVAMGFAIPTILVKLVVLPFYVSRVAFMPLSQFLTVFMLRGIILCAAFNGLFYWIFVRDSLIPNFLCIALLYGAQTLLFAAFAWMSVFTRSERQYLLSHLQRWRF